MGERKILTIILGSPKSGGNTETLADALAEGAAEKGYEIRKVRAAKLLLKGCLDCRHCWSTGHPCVQRDDMEKVYAEIEPASVIVFAAPLYYYTWPAQVKPIFDRLLPYGAKDSPVSIAGKKCVLISAGGDDKPEIFDGLRATYLLATGFLKWTNAGDVCAYGFYTHNEIAEKGAEWLEKAREIGRSL